MFYFDPMYMFYVMIPSLILTMWAQAKLRSAYARGQEVRASSGMTGAETAQRILDIHNIRNVAIERADSFLGDHYDSRAKVLRLSPDVYDGESLTSVGIAAHEVGHAIQDAESYAPLNLRNAIVPLAMTGTNLSWICIMAGLVLTQFRWLAVVGVLLFSLFVLFQIITLPVEFDASRRARAILVGNGLVTHDEDQVVGKVLSAAAMTYVAAMLTAILQLLYYISLINRRR